MNLQHLRADYIIGNVFKNFKLVKFISGISNSFFLALLLVAILIALILLIIRSFLLFKRSLNEKSVLLELTPPSVTEKTAYTTQQLFSVIHNLANRKTFREKILGRKTLFSFEIASSLNQGIRYLVRTTPKDANNVKRSLLSYLPQVRVKTINDYLPDNTQKSKKLHSKIIEFSQQKHFAYPLKRQDTLSEHDPVAYITGMMTKLSQDELISFQLILSPVKTGEARRIKRMILRNEDVIAHLDKFRVPAYIKPLSFVLKVLVGLLKVIGSNLQWAVTELMNGSNKDYVASRKYELHQQMLVDSHAKPPRILNSFEQESVSSVQAKIDQPLFETSLRVLVMVKDNTEQRERIDGFISSLETFSVPGYQSFVEKHGLPDFIWGKIRLLTFQKRLLSFLSNTGSSLLSVSEVADLYHFPYTGITKTEGLVKSRSRQLPAPLSLKNSDTNFDVVIGVNQYGGELSPIGITLEQRLKHMYIIGKTGMGKTTLLASSIFQDMVNGKGLAVLDPHGDMIQELLRIVPKNRRNDVIFFDPSDREWPIGLNLLSPGIKFSSQEDGQDWITSSVLAVFKKLADEQYWGPRMEHILRNATLTALQTPNPNLYTIQRLLTDKTYQKKVALTLKDPILKQFWQKEFALMGNMQLSSVTAPLTQRLGSFISSKMSRHILLQEKSSISISNIMDEGKILLVNLSKGDLGEDQSFFFGTILTSFIWMAAYQRTKIPENKRRDFFLYVDEFQNFATPRFSEITSEGRKFHVSLIASHQNIAQVEDKDILKVVAGNANTIVCLKASPDDEAFILPFMDPEVEKGDIVNLAPFNFFMKVTGDESEDAFSGKTVPIDAESSEKTKDEIISYTRKHYAMPRKVVEEYLEKLFAEDEQESAKGKQAKAATTIEKTKTSETNHKAKAALAKKPARKK